MSLPDDFDPSTLDQSAVDFLHHLYAPYQCAADLTVEFRFLGKMQNAPRRWFPLTPPGLYAAVHHAQTLRDRYSVYMGVVPRVGQGGGSGKDLRLCAWLWVDLDGGNQTPADALALLTPHVGAGTIPKPHLLVQSGGGVHAYWRLSEPVEVSTREQQERVSSVLKRLVRMIGGAEGGAHACPASVDCPRILRLPGTYNHKLETPRLVRLLRCEADKGACRPFKWWDCHLDPLMVYTPRKTHSGYGGGASTLAPATEAKLTVAAPDGEKHRTMVSVAVAARKAGCDETAIRNFAEQVGQVSRVPMSDPEQQRHLDYIVEWATRTVQPDYSRV